jgi:hypothetical protein
MMKDTLTTENIKGLIDEITMKSVSDDDFK